MPQPPLARVLLADDDLASRLTVKTILCTAGYTVDCAATSFEAMGRLEDFEYQLVLADFQPESEDAALGLLAYARQKDYHPATARISSRLSNESPSPQSDFSVVSVTDDTVSHLLERVADLISHRADRQMLRAARQAA